MKKVTQLITLFLFAVGFIGTAQQTPAPKQSETITIKGATAHIGNGEVIENSVIVFENGTITAIGGSNTGTQGRVIDASGKHVYPGFIAPTKSLGLVEVDAVRPSDDQDELGEMIPNVRSLIAYNAESKVVESMRPNGVLIGQTTPNGGRISGTSSIVQFDAWNWEDAAVKTDDGIHLHWPNTFRRGRWWVGEPRGWQPNKDYQKDVTEVRQFFLNAKAYGNGTAADENNESFKATQGAFDGSKKVYVYAHGEKEMIDAVTALRESGVQEVVIVGGYEAYKIIPFLKQNSIPVLVREPHSLPYREDDDYDHSYKLPKLLAEGGVLVAIQNEDMANFQTRNMAFYAGHVAGQGLEKEEALKLITSNSAKILGIDDRYGTLETGKSATLFVSEGDALDMRTNLLSHAFIDGREISLETHQTKLWKRYMNKYEREQ